MTAWPSSEPSPGYLHDMGNFVSRTMHSQTGAAITYDLLKELGMSYGEIGIVMAAIGNHEEEFGHPVNAAGAALIVADKSDVHRVQGPGEGPVRCSTSTTGLTMQWSTRSSGWTRKRVLSPWS